MIGYTLMGLAGIANGFGETLDAEPNYFGNGDGWWEANSWKRKYKDYDGGDHREAYIGSKSILAWTTDADHFFPAVQKACLVSGTASLTIGEKLTWKTVKRLAVGWIVYGMTSHSTYNWLRYGKLVN